MVKKSVELPSTPEWNLNFKEPWLIDFEKQAVNDEKWSCTVTAAIQAEAQAEECIQIFTQCVATGLRKAIRIITLSDVSALLKEFNQKSQSNKRERKNSEIKKSKKKLSNEKFKSSQRWSVGSPKIVDLAAKYAEQSDTELELPPVLMAGLIKHLILNMKNDYITQKKIEIAKQKRKRKKKVEARFIQSLKPFEIREEEKVDRKTPSNILGIQDPIDDKPFGGPDLYIILIDFYDPFYFPELIRINVPFIALLKIVYFRDSFKWSYTSVPEKPETPSKKAYQVSQFWKTIKESSDFLDKALKFKDIAMIQYQIPVFKPTEPRQQIYKTIFEELSLMQYSAYRLYRQHQVYLGELLVQRNFLSLKPLDLSTCGVYNKLCDALITGGSNTLWLVLYAMIEQVVAGIPDREEVPLEYDPQRQDFYKIDTKSEDSDDELVFHARKSSVQLITPCLECRGKKYDPIEICRHLEESVESLSGEWTATDEEEASSNTTQESVRAESLEETSNRNEPILSESLIMKILSETESEKQNKKWKSPKLCFYGDTIGIETYECDARLLDPNTIVDRFLKNAGILQMWAKYPELPPENRAYYDYHFQTLLSISKENRDVLKIKIFFTILMKFIAMARTHLYKGEDENVSEFFPPVGREKLKKLSKVRFEHNAIAAQMRPDGKNFSNYFFKNFFEDSYLKGSKKGVRMSSIRSSLLKTDSHNLRKITSQFSICLVTHRSSGVCYPFCYRPSDNADTSSTGPWTDKENLTLNTLLDCFEISSITEPHLLNDKEDYHSLIEGFKFFEKLDPNRMVQVLLAAQENYNTVQCSFFAPTDTLLIIMHNDCDYRGVFYSNGIGILHTPVGLRDFYTFVYPEISEWLVEEKAEHSKMVNRLLNKVKEKEKKEDDRFLDILKEQYNRMSEEKRIEYLQTKGKYAMEVDIGNVDLPTKPKFSREGRVSFIATNFRDIRVETQNYVHEYYSKDGTEVSVITSSWLYDPSKLLRLAIKKGTITLFYYQWIGSDECNQNFTLKTASDVIVAFLKENAGYKVEISWPTGLIIQKMTPDGCDYYIKQGYLKVYRKNLDIREETSRCFLTNGQVVVFKENGSTEILFGSGVKCTITEVQKKAKTVSRFEITNSVGEVWEIMNKEYSHKKKLMTNLKIYIGVDPKTREIFYKREDGVSCMLWPSGKLVTNFPDGTKITSVPDFEEDEVELEWTLEEKAYFEEKYRDELPGEGSLETESFVWVSCSYLLEHPRYTGVYFTPNFVQLNLPEDITIKHRNNVYELRKNNHVLNIQSDVIEFYTECNNCENRSVAVLTPNSTDVLCKFDDFTNHEFFMYKNGSTTFQDNNKDRDDISECEVKNGDTYSIPHTCNHNKPSFNQRCFSLERDLSGFEFIHSESFANYCYGLPENTYYELDSKSPDTSLISHMFSSSYSRTGSENWIMKYANNDSLPNNLKRVDLREQKQKETQRKFSLKKNSNGDTSNNPRCRAKVVEMPKIVVTRIVKCLSQERTTVNDDLKKCVYAYQKRARELCDKYRNYKMVDDRAEDVKMRLRKIALTLCQSLKQYPHLCSQTPSTEKEIHYFGHFIKTAEDYKGLLQEDDMLPDCKQIPRPLPRMGDFGAISEENESFDPF